MDDSSNGYETFTCGVNGSKGNDRSSSQRNNMTHEQLDYPQHSFIVNSAEQSTSVPTDSCISLSTDTLMDSMTHQSDCNQGNDTDYLDPAYSNCLSDVTSQALVNTIDPNFPSSELYPGRFDNTGSSDESRVNYAKYEFYDGSKLQNECNPSTSHDFYQGTAKDTKENNVKEFPHFNSASSNFGDDIPMDVGMNEEYAFGSCDETLSTKESASVSQQQDSALHSTNQLLFKNDATSDNCSNFVKNTQSVTFETVESSSTNATANNSVSMDKMSFYTSEENPINEVSTTCDSETSFPQRDLVQEGKADEVLSEASCERNACQPESNNIQAKPGRDSSEASSSGIVIEQNEVCGDVSDSIPAKVTDDKVTCKESEGTGSGGEEGNEPCAIDQVKQETKDDCELDASQPPSPMVASINFSLVEDQKSLTSEENLEEPSVRDEKKTDVRCERLTRAKTGTLPSAPSRLVDEINDEALSDDSNAPSISDEDWEYAEGTESAPSVVDPSITAPECVLRVVPEEMSYYETMFSSGIDAVLKMRIHCTICGRHMGAAPNYIHMGNQHKVLRVLICNRCRAFYGKGKFPRDSDGSELYCRWCGQGGQVICCSHCPNVFCKGCLRRNFGSCQVKVIEESNDWSCVVCNYRDLWHLRGVCWGVLKYTMNKKREAMMDNDVRKMRELEEDKSKCCASKKHRKRKPISKVKANMSKDSSNCPRNPSQVKEEFMSGHFLLQDMNSDHDDCAGDMDFDPSQFVQPVLEEVEEAPVNFHQQPRISIASRPAPVRANLAYRQMTPVRQPNRMAIMTPRIIVNPVRATRPPAPPVAPLPRLIIRPRRVIQPGLVPIRNKSISVRPPMVVLNDQSKVKSNAAQSLVRTPTITSIQSMDGVRSLDQLRSLSSVEWFRDGLDNMRAVGVAVTKRLRELEARFHSLKNKDDHEKVMLLGKKLHRLGKKTEKRYAVLNAQLLQGCKGWLVGNARRKGKIVNDIPNHVNIFEPLNEPFSDWDDEIEISKPLEKVLIPVTSNAFQGNQTLMPRLISSAPVQTQSRPPPLVTSNTNVVRMQYFSPPPRLVRPAQPGNTLLKPSPRPSVLRPRMLTPSLLNPFSPSNKGSDLMKLLNNSRILDSTGNSVSITVSSSKRKREDSDSDVEFCPPSIPDLIRKHNIKPCLIQVEKCDQLAKSLLAARSREVNSSNSDSESDIVLGDTVKADCGNVNEVSDDDDIQIIEEVNPSSRKPIEVNELSPSPVPSNQSNTSEELHVYEQAGDSNVAPAQLDEHSDREQLKEKAIPDDSDDLMGSEQSKNDASTAEELDDLADSEHSIPDETTVPLDPEQLDDPVGSEQSMNDAVSDEVIYPLDPEQLKNVAIPNELDDPVGSEQSMNDAVPDEVVYPLDPEQLKKVAIPNELDDPMDSEQSKNDTIPDELTDSSDHEQSKKVDFLNELDDPVGSEQSMNDAIPDELTDPLDYDPEQSKKVYFPNELDDPLDSEQSNSDFVPEQLEGPSDSYAVSELLTYPELSEPSDSANVNDIDESELLTNPELSEQPDSDKFNDNEISERLTYSEFCEPSDNFELSEQLSDPEESNVSVPLNVPEEHSSPSVSTLPTVPEQFVSSAPELLNDIRISDL